MTEGVLNMSRTALTVKLFPVASTPEMTTVDGEGSVGYCKVSACL